MIEIGIFEALLLLTIAALVFIIGWMRAGYDWDKNIMKEQMRLLEKECNELEVKIINLELLLLKSQKNDMPHDPVTGKFIKK